VEVAAHLPAQLRREAEQGVHLRGRRRHDRRARLVRSRELQVAEFAARKRRLNSFVAVEEPQRHPRGIRQIRHERAHAVGEPRDGALQGRRAFADPVRAAADLAARHFRDRLHQRGQPFAEAGGGRHDAHAEITREAAIVDLDATALRLVHQVQADHDAVRDLEHLQHDVQVAFEHRGIDDHDGHIRLAEEHEVARHLFVETRRQQRIGAGQVHQLEALVAVRKRPFGARHRLAGPVAGVLPEARERVEHGALAGVGIAGERDHVVVAGHVHAELLQVAEVVRRTDGARLRRGVTHAEASWTFCT
jgi:hypothetical protein